MTSLSEELSRPPVEIGDRPEHLVPLFAEGDVPTLSEWLAMRSDLVRQWREAVGEPSFGEFDRAPEVIDEFEADYCRGTVLLQPTGPYQRQQVWLMEPREAATGPRPGAVVPFYHPDLMAGYDLEKRAPMDERPVVQFGRHLVERGFVVVCTEAYPFNTVPEPDDSAGFGWWQAATEKLLRDNPDWTGIGKLTWDTSRAVDLLLARPDVDESRVLAIGHSLGGKMSFYTTAFDERITACIGSDFGIAWDFTNWDAPWYFGEQIHAEDFALNGHHALALIAPRSFLCIAGEADRPESWQYIREAQRVYRLYNRESAAGCFMHMTGHQPTEESIEAAYGWLDEQFAAPPA